MYGVGWDSHRGWLLLVEVIMTMRKFSKYIEGGRYQLDPPPVGGGCYDHSFIKFPRIYVFQLHGIVRNAMNHMGYVGILDHR